MEEELQQLGEGFADQKPSRAERNAQEIVDILRMHRRKHVREFDTETLSRLSALCYSVPGTESLRKYALELFESARAGDSLDSLPHHLQINLSKGAFGLFEPAFAKEFERKQVLLDLPIKEAIERGTGNLAVAACLRETIELWRERFERVYTHPPETGTDVQEVRKIIEHAVLSRKEKTS